MIIFGWRTRLNLHIHETAECPVCKDDRVFRVVSLRRWFTLTFIMGLTFVVGQAIEYVELVHHGIKINGDGFGSMYYLTTGFHGLHVIGGLLFMVAVGAAIAGRTSRAPAHSTLEVCAYYWHFVDVVWIAMFLTIFVLK